MNSKRIFSASVWREGKWFVAQCLEVDVASQGRSEATALRNLADALELHFTPPPPPGGHGSAKGATRRGDGACRLESDSK